MTWRLTHSLNTSTWNRWTMFWTCACTIHAWERHGWDWNQMWTRLRRWAPIFSMTRTLNEWSIQSALVSWATCMQTYTWKSDRKRECWSRWTTMRMSIDDHVTDCCIHLVYTLPLLSIRLPVCIQSGSITCIRLKTGCRQSELTNNQELVPSHMWTQKPSCNTFQTNRNLVCS